MKMINFVMSSRLLAGQFLFVVCVRQSGTGTGFCSSITLSSVGIIPPILHKHVFITDAI